MNERLGEFWNGAAEENHSIAQTSGGEQGFKPFPLDAPKIYEEDMTFRHEKAPASVVHSSESLAPNDRQSITVKWAGEGDHDAMTSMQLRMAETLQTPAEGHRFSHRAIVLGHIRALLSAGRGLNLTISLCDQGAKKRRPVGRSGVIRAGRSGGACAEFLLRV
uniref:Uncharacterized protein n=1 Tax=Streptomyces sp. NBC_00049 TaxID=2903617 RepID=A0AAU2K398_9ACTN